VTGGNGILTLERELRNGVEVLRAAGEVDLSNAAELEDALMSLAADRAVIDLTAVTYIDSAGIRALDHGVGALLARGGRFCAVAPAGSPARLMLRVSGYALDAVADDLAAGLSSFSVH